MAPPVTPEFGEITVFVGLILIISKEMFRNFATVWAHYQTTISLLIFFENIQAFWEKNF
jgi:hypothetical protein